MSVSTIGELDLQSRTSYCRLSHTVRLLTVVQFSCQLCTYCTVHDCCTIFLPATVHTVRFMTVVPFSCQLPYILSGSLLLYNFPASYCTYCPVHGCCTVFLSATVHTVRFMAVVQFSCQLCIYCPVHGCCTAVSYTHLTLPTMAVV